MKLKSYPKMKDSGIEWIGMIPEVWILKKARFFIIIHGSYAQFTEYENGISYFKVDDLNYTSQNLMLEDSETKVISKGKPTPKLSILIPKRGEAINTNKVVISKTECYFDSNVMGLEILSSFSTKFVAYFLLSRTLSDLVDKTTIPQINNKHIKPLVFSFPQSCIEQEQIAQFLDTQTNKINSEISKHQKLINLLREKRQNLINQAVTKGLDPTVPMKDSQIPWIGKIPQHWNKQKITSSCELRGRIGWKGLTTDDYRDVGPILLGVSNISKNFELDLTKLTRISEEGFRESPEIIVQENDILLAKSGATTGKVCIVRQVTEPTTVNAAVNIIRCIDLNLNPQFLYWFLSSSIMQEALISYAFTSAQPNLFQRDIQKLDILMPSYNEQKEIIHHINKQTTKIDSLLFKIESQIEKLEEFHQSLISSAVTGKIDLRNYSISA